MVGRQAELGLISVFLSEEDGSRTLVLSGPAGVGKTTLWEAALESAASTGSRVLVTRAAESELPLSFVAINDLLRDVELAKFPNLPGPQRRGLEVVLYRADPAAETADVSAASLAVVHVLDALAAREPVLVAMDDVQWLDRASLELLSFAARRLGNSSVRFLLTRRAAESAFEQALSPGTVERVELSGLTLGATRLLLRERLGLVLPRRLLRQLYERAAGNPLLVLELGRLAARGVLDDSVALEPLPRAEELFGERVAALSPSVRCALLAVALSPGVTEQDLARVAGDGLAGAFAAGLLVRDRQRVRVVHPLLAVALRGRSNGDERRALHLQLGKATEDPMRRVRHAALGADAADPRLARALDDASEAALARGALSEAVELAQHALRLTEHGDTARAERLLVLAERLLTAGELQAITGLLGPRLDDLPPGRARARAHLLLGEASTVSEHERQLAFALEQASDQPDLIAAALSAQSILLALIRVSDIPHALAVAESALAAATASTAPEAQARALHALAWARILSGRDIGDLAAQRQTQPVVTSLYESATDRPHAVRLAWRGETLESRAMLDHLLDLATKRGEARSSIVLHLHRCELELRAGDTMAAAEALEAWEEWTGDESPADVQTIRARCHALLAATQGHPEESLAWAELADTSNQVSGFVWDTLELLRARALAAIHAGDPESAAECLAQVWAHTTREGIADPGAFPVAGDLVDALVAVDERDQTDAILARLRSLATEQNHPWALATIRRCEALAEAPSPATAPGLAAAANDYLALGLRFDAARTLLAAGRAARRRRRWRDAQEMLNRAAAIFDAAAADGWAALARSEIPGRRAPGPGELTAAERSVARLAATGLSNKEIARNLTISVSTVETHLKRIYSKLGVNSRARLASRLDAPDQSIIE